MKISVITIFPEIFAEFFRSSIIGKAVQSGKLVLGCVNPRDFAYDRHKKCDDTPFGGGAGMVMKPEPLSGAIEKVMSESSQEKGKNRIIYLSPGGKTFNQGLAQEYAALPELTLLCGHYEGIDQRIIDHYVTDEISVGDYILSSGVTAAMVVTDAVCRLVPGVISEGSHECESFTGGLLEYPQYTRPRMWMGHEVPEVLFSGHHEVIRKWRSERSIEKTAKNRPDLLNK